MYIDKTESIEKILSIGLEWLKLQPFHDEAEYIQHIYKERNNEQI